MSRSGENLFITTWLLLRKSYIGAPYDHQKVVSVVVDILVDVQWTVSRQHAHAPNQTHISKDC